jgi:hypothetical protein
MMHRTAHGFNVRENPATIAANGRRCYAFVIVSATSYRHNAGRVMQRTHNGRPRAGWVTIDDNNHECAQFNTKAEGVEWLLNRVDRALVNETPFGGYCPDIPY